MAVWHAIESTLERGDNIQEGHYVERSWARLLAKPLSNYQVEALRKYASYAYCADFSLCGPLVRKKRAIEITFMNLNDYIKKEKKSDQGWRFIPIEANDPEMDHVSLNEI